MNFMYEYHVKRYTKTGGHYAVCFQSITPVDTWTIIDNANTVLGLPGEDGTKYGIVEMKLGTGQQFVYEVETNKVDKKEISKW